MLGIDPTDNFSELQNDISAGVFIVVLFATVEIGNHTNVY